jgi:hypothetical protein
MPVTLYAIFDSPQGRADLPVAVPERFSWLAALLPPVFLLRHRLWLQAVAWVLWVLALVIVSVFVTGVAGWLYLLSAVWLGLAAAGLRRSALDSSGWRLRGERVALSHDMAQLEALQ